MMLDVQAGTSTLTGSRHGIQRVAEDPQLDSIQIVTLTLSTHA